MASKRHDPERVLFEAMDPPPPNFAQLKADLDAKIQQLEEFLATLQ